MAGEGHIVSFLWPKNAKVLVALADRGFRSFVTLPELVFPELTARMVRRGALMRDLHEYSEGRIAVLDREAKERMAVVGSQLADIVEGDGRFDGQCPRGALAGAIRATLHERVRSAIGIVDALQQCHDREGIAALLLSETYTSGCKAAALWAGAAGVPRFMLMHGANINQTGAPSVGARADWIMTYGDRAFGSHFDDGVDRAKLVATGNPAWDYFHELPPPGQRSLYREGLAAVCGFRPELPTVLFATTWRARVTSLEDQGKVADPARCFLRACKSLEAEGLPFNACIKGRVSNNEAELAELRGIVLQEGAPRCAMLPPASDMAYALLGCDVLVACDSNASIEATLLGIPTINIWALGSWLMGPAFDAGDAIEQVRYDQPAALADRLRSMLLDERIRSVAAKRALDRVGLFNVSGDRTAGDRVADFIARKLIADADEVRAKRARSHS